MYFYSKIKKIKVDNIMDETEFGPEHSLGLVQDFDVYISGKTDQIPSMYYGMIIIIIIIIIFKVF